MEEYLISALNGAARKIVLDAAGKEPVLIITGSSKWESRKPLVLLSAERYEAMKAEIKEGKL